MEIKKKANEICCGIGKSLLNRCRSIGRRRLLLGGTGAASVIAVGFFAAKYLLLQKVKTVQDQSKTTSVSVSAPQPFVDEEPLPKDVTAPPTIKGVTAPPTIKDVTAPPAITDHAEPIIPVPPVALKQASWLRYSKPFVDPAGHPVIALVIDDLGLNRRLTQRAMALPGAVTLAFMTYADDLSQQTAEASSKAHELLLHVPMQPLGQVDPGPNALMDGDSPLEIRRRLLWGLDRFDGYVGINNHMGSRFSANQSGMAVVMTELNQRSLMFLDSRTASNSKGMVTASAAHVPAIERNIFIDNVDEYGAVMNQLSACEAMANKHGIAIAIGHPRDATFAAIEAWEAQARKRGYKLIPVTTALRILGQA